jgi:hypothetical protein
MAFTPPKPLNPLNPLDEQMMEHVRVTSVAVGRNWWDVDVGRADDSGTSVGTSSAWLEHVLSPRASAPGCGPPATNRSLSHPCDHTGHKGLGTGHLAQGFKGVECLVAFPRALQAPWVMFIMCSCLVHVL